MSQVTIILRCNVKISGLLYRSGDVATVRDTVARSLCLQRKATYYTSPSKAEAEAKRQEAAASAPGGSGAQEADNTSKEPASDGPAPIKPEDTPEGGPLNPEDFALLASQDFAEARKYAAQFGVKARSEEGLVARYRECVQQWAQAREVEA